MAYPEFHTNSSGDFIVTDDVLQRFEEWGFILVRNFLDKEELALLKETVEGDAAITSASDYRDDGHGGKIRVSIWEEPVDDVTGAIGRSEKAAGTFQKLLKDEVFHYYAKVVMKDAGTGGSLVWHQDYGYWYNNSFLFPEMGTLSIAIDDADAGNGCLQIIPKSHKAGRIDHVKMGDQAGADVERVMQLKDMLGHEYVELKGGDALFFHCNLLHRSDRNDSERRRWSYLLQYCTKRNTPNVVNNRTRYKKLHMLPNSAIKECKGDEKNFTSRKFFSRNDFDASVVTLKEDAEQ